MDNDEVWDWSSGWLRLYPRVWVSSARIRVSGDRAFISVWVVIESGRICASVYACLKQASHKAFYFRIFWIATHFGVEISCPSYGCGEKSTPASSAVGESREFLRPARENGLSQVTGQGPREAAVSPKRCWCLAVTPGSTGFYHEASEDPSVALALKLLQELEGLRATLVHQLSLGNGFQSTGRVLIPKEYKCKC